MAGHLTGVDRLDPEDGREALSSAACALILSDRPKATPIVLVPEFWLGAWAWDEVAADLRAKGFDVTAVTLPGLESAGTDRSSITLARPRRRHPRGGDGGGASVVRAQRRRAPRCPRKELEANESLEGLSDEQLETFRRRAVPEPGAALREATELTNDARLDVPTTVVCRSLTSERIKDAVKEGYAWVGGLAELRDVTYVDLPTSHWPMWSRPQELAAVIGDAAQRV